MARYHGKSGVVYMSTSGSGNASSVAQISSWSIDRATDKAEVTAFGDTNKVYVQGLPDMKGSFSGFWDDTETKIFTGADSTDGVKMYLYPSSNASTAYWYGTAWIDAKMDVGVSDSVKVSVDWVAAGAWSRKVI